MDKPIKIFMCRKDAQTVQKIFDRSDDPKFTIVTYWDMPDTDVTMLELYAESMMYIWYLAKSVEMEQAFDDRMEQIKKQLDETQKENAKKISQ